MSMMSLVVCRQGAATTCYNDRATSGRAESCYSVSDDSDAGLAGGFHGQSTLDISAPGFTAPRMMS